MMRTIDTIQGQGYVLTGVTVPATVKAVLDDGSKVELVKLEKAGQVCFVAISSTVEVDDDDALVTPANFRVALSGASSGGGELPANVAYTDKGNTFGGEQLFRERIKTNNVWAFNGTRNLLQTPGMVGSTLKVGEATAFNLLFASYNARPTVIIGSTNKGAVVTEEESNTFTGRNSFTQSVGVADGVLPGDAVNLGQVKAEFIGLRGNQTIWGNKTFENIISINSHPTYGLRMSGDNLPVVTGMTGGGLKWGTPTKENRFEGASTFSNPVAGVEAVNDDELVTLGQVKAMIAALQGS